MGLFSFFNRAARKFFRIADPFLCRGQRMFVGQTYTLDNIKVIYCTQYFIAPSPQRQQEINQCIRSNTSLPWFTKSLLFCDRNSSPPFAIADPVLTIQLKQRLTYKDVFEWVRHNCTDPDWLIILANSDILMPDKMPAALHYIGEYDFMALTRYEDPADRFPFLIHSRIPGSPSISQDTWIFRAGLVDHIRNFDSFDIPLGVPGCENRVVAILDEMKICVSNPCLDLKTFHLHKSDIRSYTDDHRVHGPYGHPRTMTVAQFCVGRRYWPRIDSRIESNINSL